MSGAQNWNGTAETLNPNPTVMSRIDARASVSLPAGRSRPSATPISCRFVVPVTPYIRLIP
ncbi:hypothetical protein HRbin12_00896 [bacterium HR12]|nr:hypothetical protein HRbin12_00896 [bacterium HR12]